MTYADYFKKATRFHPYPYQTQFAECTNLPVLLNIPTGAGKTETTILGWLYRRFEHPNEVVRDCTPRRLVYCLPMRTLVEQTVERVEKWLANLGMANDVGVVKLMGGEPRTQWYLHPEKAYIIVGTQDMLLSRALNRGYGTGYNMWPVEYGLLNNDCLWVMDEVQLMANGLPTSTQLAGLRGKLGTFGPAKSMWMSATARRDWLGTIDHPAPSEDRVVVLGDGDLTDPRLGKRHKAKKVVTEETVKGGTSYARDMARLIAEKHKPGTMTLAIVNTVERAQAVYAALKNPRTVKLNAEPVLIHSRFREDDRQKKQGCITAPLGPAGRIVVATQAVEAGVDISARTLITELAPWTSMVQRFGRCNREGKYERGDVLWVDVEKDVAPYGAEDIDHSHAIMESLQGKSVGPVELEEMGDKMKEADHTTVIRRRDVVGLFDTTPDLSGSYLDVSQYVRGTDETGVTVFWRDVPDGPNEKEPKPRHNETVSVPLGGSKGGPKGIKDYLDGERKAWRWDFLDDMWREVQQRDTHPGMTLMLDANQGGYDLDMGWDASRKARVEPVSDEDGELEDGQGSDPTNTRQKRWMTLSAHSRHVESEAIGILDALSGHIAEPEVRDAVASAALYHDAGKAHPAFQKMLRHDREDAPSDDVQLAKGKGRGKYEDGRRHFRHELGSALAVLKHAESLEGKTRDLAAYLVASHHGKVRLGIRSLPGQRVGSKDSNPDPDRLLGYHVSEPETLPGVDLGEDLVVPETTLDTSIAQMGIDENERRSWLERSLALLEWLGPFRLAYLETIVRAADMRASKAEQETAE